MKILVVDSTTESQAQIAAKIDEIDQGDLDALDVTVNLSGTSEYKTRLAEADVLILGPMLGDQAKVLAQEVNDAQPHVEIIMLVSDEAYWKGAYRVSSYVRVRKVITESTPAIDIFQELVNIHQDFCVKGRSTRGHVLVTLQAKGGVGTSSICAALGELCGNMNQHTLLWDLDIESSDLSRSLLADSFSSEVVKEWIEGSTSVTRDNFKRALASLSNTVSILSPPAYMPAAIDMVGHPDGVAVVNRLVDLARFTHDTIIVDTAGRMGPATGSLILSADTVLVVVDDTLLGLAAAHRFIDYLKQILPNTDRVRILCSGVKLSPAEIADKLDPGRELSPKAWSLPAIPFESAASKWPGMGKTLYSVGSKNTRRAFEEVVSKLGLGVERELRSKAKVFKFSGLRGVLGKKASNA